MLKNFFAQQQTNLDFLRVWRYIFSKILWSKLGFSIYLHNKAFGYFAGRRLKMPEAMARPFGAKLGALLTDEDNQFFLYLLFSFWLAVAL